MRFPPPLAHLSPDPRAFEFVWARLDYVYELPPPAEFPALAESPADEDLETLERYVAAAEEMAESALLSGGDRITLRAKNQDAPVTIDSEFSSKEVTRGFTTLFRQFDSSDGERASFPRVSGLLRRLSDAQGDGRATERGAILTRWRDARASLRQESLEVRVQQKQMGGMALPDFMDGQLVGQGFGSPEALISKFQYGDLIHWGRHASDLQELSADEIEEGLTRMAFLQAVTGLTHLYLGFSLVLRAALGR